MSRVREFVRRTFKENDPVGCVVLFFVGIVVAVVCMWHGLLYGRGWLVAFITHVRCLSPLSPKRGNPLRTPRASVRRAAFLYGRHPERDKMAAMAIAIRWRFALAVIVLSSVALGQGMCVPDPIERMASRASFGLRPKMQQRRFQVPQLLAVTILWRVGPIP